MTLEISDALSFFRLSCGRWRSQRSQHHLLHRRAEAGASFIVVEELLKGDPRLAEIAERNGEEVSRVVGGCWVRWSGSMAWDRAGESHEDQTMFGLIPSDDAGRSGLLLRDRGYAEKAPVAGERPDPDHRLRNDEFTGAVLVRRTELAAPDQHRAGLVQQRLLLHGDPPARRRRDWRSRRQSPGFSSLTLRLVSINT